MKIKSEHLQAVSAGHIAIISEIESGENIGIVIPVETNDDDLREQIGVVCRAYYGVEVIVDNIDFSTYRITDFYSTGTIDEEVQISIIKNPFLALI